MSNTTHPLTVRYEGLTNVIKSEAAISTPFIEGNTVPVIKKYVATWDTGASCTVITQKIVDELKLQQIDIIEAHSANMTERVPVYLVNVILPSNVAVQNVRVIKMDVTDSDMLIGMDILAIGDFSITNFNAKTCMTFRIPSSHDMDYVRDANIAALPRKQRRHYKK